jgi:hypothetical protein
MSNMESMMSPTDGPRSFAMSPAGYRVLGLLHKGCAYQVRGAWRVRGLRSSVKEPTLLFLLKNGLAERVETDRHAQLRITPAGRSVRSDAG